MTVKIDIEGRGDGFIVLTNLYADTVIQIAEMVNQKEVIKQIEQFGAHKRVFKTLDELRDWYTSVG